MGLTNVDIPELEYRTSKMHMELSQLRSGVSMYVCEFKSQGSSVREKLLISSLQSKTVFQL